MFTKKNHGDDSSLPVDLTNDDQIYETDMPEWSHQLYDDVAFVFNETYEEDRFLSPCVLHDEKPDFFEAASRWFLEQHTTYREQRILAIGNDIAFIPLIQGTIFKRPTWFEMVWCHEQELRFNTRTHPFGWLESLANDWEWFHEIPANVTDEFKWNDWPVCFHGTHRTHTLLVLANADRYDDLVDRYHNNIHFMHKQAQLIRDLILFRLPTSVHSQCTMLGAFAARSSQVDYGERNKIANFCLNYQSSSALDYYTQDMFFYRFLNHVLRQQRYDILYQYRHAIIDVIERLRRPSPSEDDSVSLVLYRGQLMTIFELEKMKNNVGKLVSCASFFSTTMNPQLAEIFAGDGSDDNPRLVSVIFKIYLDDDLVDRYHNNIHFMHSKDQLIRDLILFRLPTSVHSQCTMLGAFAARSSQVDYGERKKIENFCLNYQSSSALDYYTQDMFFHRFLNHVLRQQRHDIIYQYRHAIIDVIERLRRPSPSKDDSVSLVLYRGQLMTIFEREKLKNNVGELINCTSLFSTTMNPQLAEIFAGDGSDDNPCLVSVIFKIYLDTGQPMRPYALIYNSAEEEVLFSPGTKFVLMSCRKLHDNGRLWLFELNAVPEKQQEQLALNHGETFSLLSSASGWPTSVVVVHLLIT